MHYASSRISIVVQHHAITHAMTKNEDVLKITLDLTKKLDVDIEEEDTQ